MVLLTELLTGISIWSTASKTLSRSIRFYSGENLKRFFKRQWYSFIFQNQDVMGLGFIYDSVAALRTILYKSYFSEEAALIQEMSTMDGGTSNFQSQCTSKKWSSTTGRIAVPNESI